ncbi:hypothetical protein RHGRI_006787 [Rhododendron griersonianum]|uniref:RCC1-like domain-containing protein n=1 Tax=Rhododendron griersonianum TaxID=479676 RepID=A0AAV6KUW3_9ERIC|nr:hypothetical protein RHGRI_006787 [Rhododendron griersonianum]
MEEVVSSHSQKQNLQPAARRNSSSGTKKDLWLVVREGSVADVDLALALLKKVGGNINARNVFGLTPLHVAIWRNHIPIVKRLLAAGADPNARDGESGWSSLHRALHFGHLAVASILIQSGASTTVEDSKYRTPVDLVSGPVSQAVGNGDNSVILCDVIFLCHVIFIGQTDRALKYIVFSLTLVAFVLGLVATEVFSWGSGVNYQLGTGNAHIQKLPCKVDALHGSFIKLISAAKFHSVAVTGKGEVYTWGFGRGGRLGHPDFDIHSGQAAVITPRLVTSGLGARKVKAIAAAKHHTVVATEGGDVFTWGSNREGQLGYTSVDTQPTPRRVSSLRSKIVAVAAANKHTAVVSDSGEVFTWGCNKEGQLGYGTSNSASNYTPRLIEYLKGKVFVGVVAAKYHTIVLGADGEVFTWGHRLVTPRRVVIARNIKKMGNTQLKFHSKARLHVVAAGMVHSVALTEDGSLFYWVSSDPDLRCRQLFSLCGRNIVSISAGKYWTAAVTATGDVYMWDEKKGKDKPPIATRLHGVKRATSVGETHLLIVGSLYHPVYPANVAKNPQKLKLNVREESEEFDEDFLFNDMESNNLLSTIQKDDFGQRPIPSLKGLCEKVAADFLVEPRNAMQLLEIADSLGAEDLRKHCEDIVLRNLDYILTVSGHAIAGASVDVLAHLEKLLDSRSSEPWSYRRLPTPTATFPVIINSEGEDSESELQTRDNHTKKLTSKKERDRRLDCFLQPQDNDVNKQVRALMKKLQQIEMLEAKQSSGHHLDDQQIAKLQTKSALESSLAELGLPVTPLAKASSSVSPDGKGKKRTESLEGLLRCANVSSRDEEAEVKGMVADQVSKESSFCIKKGVEDAPKNRSSLPKESKKKNKKGGLSMFLSGALDDIPKKDYAPPPSPVPKSEGPAWGGAKIAKGSTSLREIQDEQNKTKEIRPTKSKDQVEDVSDRKSMGKIHLSSFLPSNPIPVVSAHTSELSDGDRSTPPWAASGTPPLHGKQLQSLSSSPKARTTGFSVTTGQGSPSDSASLNRWFKPEVDTPSSIRSIQIEERAMKDLKRFYSSVKIVKNQS